MRSCDIKCFSAVSVLKKCLLSCSLVMWVCENIRVGCAPVWVGSWPCHINAVMMSQEVSPTSVPSLPLPPFRGTNAMTTVLIIISSIFICLAAHTPTQSHCQTFAHAIFSPGLAGRTVLLIQRRQLGPGSIYNSYAGKHWLQCLGM